MRPYDSLGAQHGRHRYRAVSEARKEPGVAILRGRQGSLDTGMHRVKGTLGRLQRQRRWGLESHCHPKEECGAISGKSQGRRLLYVCHREHGPLDIFALNF